MSNPAVAKLVAVTASLIALITLFVSVRFFVRSVLLRSVDWDDALVFLSYLCISQLVQWCGHAFLGKVGLISAVTNFGFGTPVDDVSGDDLRRFLKASNIVALLERRTDPSLAAPIRHAAGGFEGTMVVIFHCKPVDKAWNPQKEGTCLNLKLFYYISFAIKFVTDVCLFIQPIPAVWKLQLSKAKRLGAILMLSLGLFRPA
uniref:Rhodopsin domain-containing protein n=1 Tax=Fusarium oxysporum (strain Fo5176) TaxID=660025 RepID=A0A0C4DJP2_FUSOF